MFFQIIRMLAEKAKQQEEMLVEYDETEAQHKDLESEVDLLRAQVDSMKDELKVSCWYARCDLIPAQLPITIGHQIMSG